MAIKSERIEDNYLIRELNSGTIIKMLINETAREETLDEIKRKKINELQKSYYSSFTTFHSDALGSLKTYPIDLEAQNNLKDYQDRLIADTNKDTFYFKTIEDGTLVLHNRLQFLQLMDDAEMFKVNQTIKINNLIHQIDVATTQEELEMILW